MFFPELVLERMETFRGEDGLFIASPGEDHHYIWLRDTCYALYAYKYLGMPEKLLQGIWTLLDFFKKRRNRLWMRISSPTEIPGHELHTKYIRDQEGKLTEITEQWEHHQLDALAIFLYILADLRPIRDEEDIETIQLMVSYLKSVEYWERPDYGMWEECPLRHSSSTGAVVGALTYLKRQRLALVDVPDPLINYGLKALNALFPYESRDRSGRCVREGHCQESSHDCDAAQLSLIWPYHVIVNPEKIQLLLSRIVDGHATEDGQYHRLVQARGLHRYWGDNHFRSGREHNFLSGMWPMFFFWLSIIYSQLNKHREAFIWFERGEEQMVDYSVPEIYQGDRPNIHTPLVWGNALSLIAYKKLPINMQEEMSSAP